MSKQKNQTTPENLEAKHTSGDDVLDYFDTARAVRMNHKKERVNLDLPIWMIREIDKLASRTGIPRQSQIKAWLAERLKEEAA